MALLLNINTAFETASVTLSEGNTVVCEMQHASQKDHASFLEPAIKAIARQANIHLKDIDAVAVVSGPGSYTGLRVGLSSAKALCYALQKPLILLNTLDIMALALKLQAQLPGENILYCPMIDARRLEVFTAVYDHNLQMIKSYSSEVLSENFFQEEMKHDFFLVTGGNGSPKFEKITNYKKNIHVNPLFISKPLILLADKAYLNSTFSDIIYSEPYYLKPVYFKK